MKRKLLLGMLTAAGALCLSMGLAACGGGDDGQVGLSFEYDDEREAYAVTGIVLPMDSEGAIDTARLPSSVTVPAEHSGSPVYIADGAFAGYGFLESVELEAGVLSIGDNAFSGCNALATVNFPAGLVSIGEGAFADCALKDVSLPASLTEVGGGAFMGCVSLGKVTVDASNTSFTVAGGILYNQAQTELVCAPAALEGEVTLPATLKEVPAGAFYRCGLITKVTVGGGNAIGANAFSGCTSLENVSLPASVIEIGDAAFANCTALKAIALPDAARVIGAGAFENCDTLTEIAIPDAPADQVPTVGARALASCDSLERATLPESLTKIPDGLFAECGNLNSAELPAHITEIGSYAFFDCVSLGSVAIPASVVTIGERAFFGCSGLKSITAEGNAEYEAAAGCLIEKATGTVLYGSDQTAVTLPATVKKIAPYAFRFMKDIQTVALPAGLAEIGEGAFLGCNSLESITVEEGNEAFFAKSGVLYSVATKKVSNNTVTVYTFFTVPIALTGKVEIPAGVETIPANTFEYCTKIREVVLPAGLTTVGANAFAHCEGLEGITLTGDVTSIGANAFAYCTSLASFEVPDGVRQNEEDKLPNATLANYVFYNCTALENVTFGERVSNVSANAFEGCTAMKSITVAEKNTYFKSQNGILYALRTSGEKTTVTGIVHVPMQVEGAVSILAGFDTINAEAFYGRTKITSVTLTADIKKIGSYAFYGCSGLTAVHFAGDEAAWAKVDVASGNEALTNVLDFGT